MINKILVPTASNTEDMLFDVIKSGSSNSPEFPQSNCHGTQQQVDALTEREVEVLRHLSTGASNREIAHTLYISENTVRNHVRNILGKLHLTNRVQAATYAVTEGFVLHDA